MLAEHCLLADSCEGTVLLTVTPRTLTTALDEAGEAVLSPSEAEADFVACVAAVYSERVLKRPDRLRALKSTPAGDVPFCIGFLALSVLAAFHMRTDEERTGRAFYPRLAEMLGRDLVHSYPVGFEGAAFIELWEELGGWLKVNYDRQLAAPAAAGIRPYIAYPLAHVPLREVDIERLPQFFDTNGYEPGARAPLDHLAYDLYDASGPWRYLTEAGRSALEDRYRRPFVVRQVAHELDRWDGSRTDSSGARTATIVLWMDIRRRRAQLHLLARRPTGFPEVIEEGELVFESSQEGWYEPVLLSSEDGYLLQQGIRVGASANGNRYDLHLRPVRVIPLTPSETYSGFVSDRVLRADTDCAVLCEDPFVGEVGQYLEKVTQGRVVVRRGDAIPAGWGLFTNVRATTRFPPPAGLDNLEIESSLALIPEGGLRLRRRWNWLESAPAKLIVLGVHRGLIAKIDGQEVPIDDGGRVETDALRVAGRHVVEIGNRLRQRVTVLQGVINADCRSWMDGGMQERGSVAVPAGRWVLIGRAPGESESVIAPPEGARVRPMFEACWAVQAGSGSGARALHIHEHILASGVAKPYPLRVPSDEGGSRWAEAIYQAGIRRPDLLCPHGCADAILIAEWRRMMQAARLIKRSGRRRR